MHLDERGFNDRLPQGAQTGSLEDGARGRASVPSLRESAKLRHSHSNTRHACTAPQPPHSAENSLSLNPSTALPLAGGEGSLGLRRNAAMCLLRRLEQSGLTRAVGRRPEVPGVRVRPTYLLRGT